MDPDRLLRGLDTAQRAAVTTTAAPLAIIAAAGSGKTTVLSRRIAHRVATGAAESRHVVALTFTRDAAGELRRRLRRLELLDPIEAGTFHSVALRLLRDRALSKHETMPGIATDRLRLMRETITELRLRVEPYVALTDLEWARARMVAPSDYERVCRAEKRRSGTPGDRFADLHAAYSRLKRRRGVIDFDDLLEMSLSAVRTDKEFAGVVRWRFRHFFVDEAQDLNPLQHALLEAWRGGRHDLCLVGDPRQAIYGWNGADHTMLGEVERSYPGITVMALTTNYRCTPQVVRAGVAALAASGQLDDTRSDQPDGPAIVVREFATDTDEAVGVARHVRTAMNHRDGSDIAVLVRTNEQLVMLHRALTDIGVQVERSAGRSPIDIALADAHRQPSREQLADWVETAFADADPFRRRVAEEADRYLTSNVSGTFRAWVESHTPFDDLMLDDRRNAVALLTFHAAKGREWHTVVIAGAESGLMPHSSAVSSAQRAEEARLFYVALTRAAHDLTITYAVQRKQNPVKRSAWLDAVQATSQADIAAPPPAALSVIITDPVAALRDWRSGVARAANVTDTAVCNDRVLRSLQLDPPADIAELAARLGVTPTAAARLRPLPSAVPRS
ncbi:MAG: ATP-dependent helicase [Ilumatobacteraceae bacterium]